MSFLAAFIPEILGATAATGAVASGAAELLGGGVFAGSGILGGLESLGLGGLATGLEGILGGGAGGGLLGSLLGGGGGKAGGLGLGNFGSIAQTLSGLYGFNESKRLRKQMEAPDPSKLTSMPGYQAGLEAVQRSLASQGYQGSGNMMAALQKYGGDAYAQMWQNNMASAQGQMNPLVGQLSSLGLGIGGIKGWGKP
jgi:hypothetical protein